MTQRDRRALIVGGGVVIAAVLLLRVLPWGVRRVLGAQGDLRARAALLARARADLAEAALLRDSAAALGRTLLGLAPKILSGGTAAEAAADLSGQVNHAAAANLVKLERMDAVPDSTAAGRLRRATLRTALECDVRGLAGLLQALERGKTVLAVRGLRVTAPDVGSPDRTPEVLRVELTVTGWYLRGRDEGRRGKGDGAP